MIDVVVHGDAESICDSIHGIEDGIAEELFPQVVPDVFGWVDLAIFLWTPGSLSGLPILEIPG